MKYGQEDYSFAKLKRMTDEVESRCCIHCRNPKQMAPYVVEPSCKDLIQSIKLIRIIFSNSQSSLFLNNLNGFTPQNVLTSHHAPGN